MSWSAAVDVQHGVGDQLEAFGDGLGYRADVLAHFPVPLHGGTFPLVGVGEVTAQLLEQVIHAPMVTDRSLAVQS